MKAQEIRERFTNFFQKYNHEKISSSPLIPQGDDTLLFANAGMNQFKDYFTGRAKAKNPRAVTIQKCVRAGGKHNDLENVGFTARHHTFFEMLGNFSFGDYFKEEAIDFAWKFLTEELKLPKDKLYVTVHYSDNEAINIWNKNIGIPLDRIFKKGDKDNFWEMGEFGPCGPCSEIFYDHGEKYTTPNFVMREGGDILDDELRYVEIWNLVFMQFEKTKDGQFPLPKPSIDTGAGLERVASAMQGVYWNYDTDLFAPILNKLESLSGKSYSKDPKAQNAMRIIADHIRSSTMLITDGVIPSNDGRGYVLRRIIRRMVRNLKELGLGAGTAQQLVPCVFESLGKEYPQNEANASLAQKFLTLEEKKFFETLEQGLKFLDEAIDKELVKNTLPGSAIFKLYDTYGFPVDLTELILKERNHLADISGFETQMSESKARSRKSWKSGASVDNKIFFDLKDKFGTTKFTGYEGLKQQAKLLHVLDMGDDISGLVFNTSSFYAEGGGQAGDSGTIEQNGKTIANIFDTQKPVDGLFIHFSKNADGLEIGQEYELVVNKVKREQTKSNHSATHLLQAALIKVLGDHVKQAGSQVGAEKLRFDFTHLQAMTPSEIEEVEKLVNQWIQSASPVDASEMSMDQAISKGALAFFGDKYGDKVRVLQMGEHSTELCGGTHVNNTSDIGLFKILNESSLSTGVRRIEATTSIKAFEWLSERSTILDQIESNLKEKGTKAVQRIDAMFEEIKEKQKEIAKLKLELQNLQSSDLFANSEKIAGYDLVCVEAPEGSDLKSLSDDFVSKYPKGILLMTANKDGKLAAMVRSSKAVKLHCSNVLKDALTPLGGRGGGRPDMAQGSADSYDAQTFFTHAKKAIPQYLDK
ncbi:MAG: alanine--tRNA ligase [Bdellovibrionales bacterium CG12_big_fil_rev_8_21_14_0_65_38_15]|nr:MAG: alanine--tRNA ligase [Bdellovibrionales bacterium CG22_combo_CG10-13_8_21_14_all_38_13]PIQ57349.1 MAG: alanine--tRNA ligase [Bdellovibrionales bacterium CG12_big_fil_rev_8_21_14_0_65_38_15]PIR28894.1 MAG: alanine--tRNA ligase [Bdellovibrionales bacterium CG11_big_fil_rev_8_21_14_0_20_38_13]